MPLLFGKFSTLFFWILCLLSWLLDWPGVLSWLPACAVAVFTIHVLEVVYFWFAFRSQSDAPAKDALQILLFGIFHLRTYIDEAAEEAAEQEAAKEEAAKEETGK